MAMRWQLLAARQAVGDKDAERARAALDLSRAALADASLVTPLDRVAWLQTESDLLRLLGQNEPALARLSQAEQLVLQHRPDDAVLIEQIQAAMSRLQRP